MLEDDWLGSEFWEFPRIQHDRDEGEEKKFLGLLESVVREYC